MERAVLRDCRPSGWLTHQDPQQPVVSMVWSPGADASVHQASGKSNSPRASEAIKNTLQITGS